MRYAALLSLGLSLAGCSNMPRDHYCQPDQADYATSHTRMLRLEAQIEQELSDLTGRTIDFDTPTLYEESHAIKIYDRTDDAWYELSLPNEKRTLSRFAIKYVCDHVGPSNAEAALNDWRTHRISTLLDRYIDNDLSAEETKQQLRPYRDGLLQASGLNLHDARMNVRRYDTAVSRTLGLCRWTPFGITIKFNEQFLAEQHPNAILDVYAHEIAHALVADELGLFGRSLNLLFESSEEESRMEETTANVIAQLYCESRQHRTHQKIHPRPPRTDDAFLTKQHRLRCLYPIPVPPFESANVHRRRYSEHESPDDPNGLQSKIRVIIERIGIISHLRLLPTYQSLDHLEKAYRICRDNPHITESELSHLLE